jgi:2-polyprenyl-6-methoxyphenol hydroxylase-like FAD-dependent oxidoreductase
MIEKKTEVLVSGAGPVGLCTALFLAEKGIRVTIVEEQWRTASRSYALALHSSSLRLFQQLGIARDLTARGNPIRTLTVFENGKKASHVNLQHVKGDLRVVLSLPQSALEELLIEKLKLKGVEVLWNHRVAGFECSENSNQVFIEKLSKDSTGYSVSRTEWVVDKSYELSADFILAADGHRSSVRNGLGIEFENLGDPHTFAVFEFQTDQRSSEELQVVLSDGTVNVLWPLVNGRFRWSFELPEAEEIDPRVKSRLLVQLREKTLPYVTEEKLKELIAQRAPWFQAEIQELIWSAAIRFERRLASGFGEGRVSLLGDAAHMALPMGIQSMNFGFREAEKLSSAIHGILRKGSPLTDLVEKQTANRMEWLKLLQAAEDVAQNLEVDGWVRKNAAAIVPCIPASGEDLEQLLKQFQITGD